MTTLRDFGGDSTPNPLPFRGQDLAAGKETHFATLQPRPEDNSRFPKVMLRTLTVRLDVSEGYLDGLKVVALRQRDKPDSAMWAFDSAASESPPGADISFPAGGVDEGQSLTFRVPVAQPPIAELRLFGRSAGYAAVSGEISWDLEAH